MELSGFTTPYAVLGHPIGHTLSPVMQNAAFRALQKDAIYLAFDVPEASLMQVLASMRAMGFGGINLTVPLKEIAFRGLTDLDESARRLGAVNTVEITSHGLRGHNTDADGFLRALDESFDLDLAGASVAIVGCGGAGRALALCVAAQGAESLLLMDTDAARTGALAGEMKAQWPGVKVQEAAPSEGTRISGADLVIHATPVGMKETDEPVLHARDFRAGQMLFDLVYMYPETGIMREASAAGARTTNGLGMLLHQGALAFEIWIGEPPPLDTMRTALETAVYAPAKEAL